MARFRMRGGGIFAETGVSTWAFYLFAIIFGAAFIALIVTIASKDRNTRGIAGSIGNTLVMILIPVMVVGVVLFVTSLF